MTKYRVIVSRLIICEVLSHMSFISNVSVEAAERFYTEFEQIIDRLGDNPFQYQVDTTINDTDEYRRAVFAKWYKCIFVVEGTNVYIDSVVDCRQDKD